MRPFSPRMYPNSVRVQRLSYPSGPQAGANPAASDPPTDHAATVQPLPSTLAPDGSYRQRARFGFAADPGVSAGDDLIWIDAGALHFTAQSPATRDGGASSTYWADAVMDS